MKFISAQVVRQWFYPYLILDLYSRKVVGREVHAEDDVGHGDRLVHRTGLAEGIAKVERDARPVLHGNNGSTVNATLELAILSWLGGKTSCSRPHVSDDNASAEAPLRIAKCRPELCAKGFAIRDEARQSATWIMHWYIFNPQHSGISYVSPAQPHAGEDRPILAKRHALYL